MTKGKPKRTCRLCNGFGWLKNHGHPGEKGRVDCPSCKGKGKK